MSESYQEYYAKRMAEIQNRSVDFANYSYAKTNYNSFQKTIEGLNGSTDVNAYKSALSELPRYKGFIDDKAYNQLSDYLSSSIKQIPLNNFSNNYKSWVNEINNTNDMELVKKRTAELANELETIKNDISYENYIALRDEFVNTQTRARKRSDAVDGINAAAKGKMATDSATSLDLLELLQLEQQGVKADKTVLSDMQKHLLGQETSNPLYTQMPSLPEDSIERIEKIYTIPSNPKDKTSFSKEAITFIDDSIKWLESEIDRIYEVIELGGTLTEENKKQIAELSQEISDLKNYKKYKFAIETKKQAKLLSYDISHLSYEERLAEYDKAVQSGDELYADYIDKHKYDGLSYNKLLEIEEQLKEKATPKVPDGYDGYIVVSKNELKALGVRGEKLEPTPAQKELDDFQRNVLYYAKHENELEKLGIHGEELVELTKENEDANILEPDDRWDSKNKTREIEKEWISRGIMTQDEIDDLKHYIKGQYQKEKNEAEMKELYSDVTEYNDLQELGITIGSSPVAFGGNVLTLFDSIYQAGRELFGGEKRPMNAYSDINAGAQWSKTVREAVQADQSDAGKFFYGIGCSLLDMGTAIAASGGIGDSLAKSVTGKAVVGSLTKNATLASMSLNAGGGAALDAMEKTSNPYEVAAIGVSSAVFEALAEKLPLDNLFKIAGQEGKITTSMILKAMGSQAVSEFGEEAATETANIIMEAIVLGDKSDWAQTVQDYIDKGYSESEARSKALVSMVGRVGMSGFAGAISGGFSGGGASTINYLAYNYSLNSTGKTLIKNNQVERLIELAETSGIDISAYNLEGKKGNYNAKVVGELYFEVMRNKSDAVTNALKEMGVSEDDVAVVQSAVFREAFGQELSTEMQAKYNQYEDVIDNAMNDEASSLNVAANDYMLTSLLVEIPRSKASNTVTDVSGTDSANADFDTNIDTDIDTEVNVESSSDIDTITESEIAEADYLDNETLESVEENEYDKTIRLMDGRAKPLTEAQAYVQSVGRALGYTVVIDDLSRGGRTASGKSFKGTTRGFFDGQTIYLHEGQTTFDAVVEIFKHEITHYAELNPEMYNKYANAVFNSKVFENWISGKGGFDQYSQSIIDKYKKHGVSLETEKKTDSPTKVEREIIAYFTSEMLFNEKGNTLERFINEVNSEDRNAISRFIHDFISWLKARLKGEKVSIKIIKLENRFAAVLRNVDNTNAQKNNTTNDGDVQYSLREIVGIDGTNYGVGVYLDSQKLDGLSEEERVEKVREHIKKLGGHPFSAFDNDGNEVKIKVAPKTKYMNEKGKRERANRHLTNFVIEKEKQESLILIDEIISAATFKEQEPAKHNHGWLDNNGQNEWDVWTTYIQDKENTIWEAKLKVTNTTNGEKVLYDVHPIEKVGPGRTMPEKPTENKIPQDTTESQELFSDRDKAYMDAVNNGDMEAAQRMVDEKAKNMGAVLDENGNPLKLYRGTMGGQTVFAKETTLNGKIYTIDNIDVASKYGDKSGKATEIAHQIKGEKSTYALYGFPKKILTIDAQYGVWSDLVIPNELLKYADGRYKATNGEIAEWAELEGYDSLRINNVRDGSFDVGNEIIFFDENLVKSADPITYDDNGNVVPLSERFNEDNNDIRYSFEDNERYAEYDKPITPDDIRLLRKIGRKSINEFTPQEIEIAQKWAYKFYQQLGTKSPFFRRWFGDWRACDISPANIVSFAYAENPKLNYAKRYISCKELKTRILVDETVINDSLHYAKENGDEKQIRKLLGKIDEIVENGILLDTQISTHSSGNKKGSTQFMHYLYTPISVNGAPFIAKLSIEEYDLTGKKRAYNIQRIELSEVSRAQYSQLIEENRGKFAYTSDALSVAQLFNLVKTYDTEFEPTPVNAALINEADGTPKVFYHGTNAQFTEFDKKKSKPGFYGRGFYFTTEKSQANVYGNEMPVYLNIKNPLMPGKTHITETQISNFLDAVAENEDYSIENYGTYNVAEIMRSIESRDAFDVIQDINATAIGDFGEAMQLFNEVNGTSFDGVITSTETVVYERNQIKSAADGGNIGTFSEAENDIRYSFEDDVADEVSSLTEQYKNGEISYDEWKSRAASLIGDNNTNKADNPVSIANLSVEAANPTPDLPKRNRANKKGDGDSKLAESIQKSDIFSKEFKDEVVDDDFIKHYDRATNKETMAKAKKLLDEGGSSFVLQWFNKSIDETSTVDVAAGVIMLDRYQKIGDMANALEVAYKLREMATISGQTVQIFSILGRFTPEMMLVYTQHELDKAYETIIKGKTNKWIESNRSKFELTEAEKEFIIRNTLVASTLPEGRDKQIKLAEIATLVQKKIPHKPGDAYKALQRICMLLNPKTNVRNIAGNAIMTPICWIDDLWGACIDNLASKKSGVRTTGNFQFGKETAKAFAQGVYESYDDFIRDINTREINLENSSLGSGNNFNENHTGKVSKYVNPISKSLNALDRITSFILDAGDRGFFQMWFINSLNNQLRLNNTTEPTAEMIEIATNDALERTWQDSDNKIVQAFSGMRGALNHLNIHGVGLGDLFIKFIKTPSNLLRASIKYSPAGFVKATSDYIKFNRSLKNGQFDAKLQRKFVNNLSKSITGTLLYVVFGFLAHAGVISGGADDDKDVAAFEKNILGVQPYSVKIGDYSFSYEWAQPIASGMAFMADLMNIWESDSRTEAEADLENALLHGSQTILNLSVFQSFQNIFKEEDLISTIINGIVNEVVVFSPQTLSQVASVTDDYSRETYEKDNKIQTVINSVKKKIPGLRNTLPESVDVYGEAVENPYDNVWDAFFNPANQLQSNSSPSAEKIYELYQNTKEKSVIPPKAVNKITINGEDITFTSEERTAFQKYRGQLNAKYLDDFTSSSLWEKSSDEEKISIIKDIYSFTNSLAKNHYSSEYELSKKEQKILEYEDFGIMSPIEYFSITTTADKDGNSYVSKSEYAEAVNNTDMSQQQKDLLIGLNEVEGKSDYSKNKTKGFGTGDWYYKENGQYVKITSAAELNRLRRNNVDTYVYTGNYTDVIDELWRAYRGY